MKQISYVSGDLIQYFKEDVRLVAIMHCVNCIGYMGTGVAKDVRDNLSGVYTKYRQYIRDNQSPLGDALLTSVGRDLKIDTDSKIVINLFGQKAIGRTQRQINYGAIGLSLFKASEAISELHKEPICIGVPWKMGCVNAGGNWEFVKENVEWFFKDHHIVYFKKESK